MRRGWKFGLIVGGILVAGGTGVLAAVSSETSPYYVDGARPLENPQKDATVDEACVPYSPERTDLHVCQDIPDGYEAGTAPGGQDVYPDVCAMTLEKYQFEGQLPVPAELARKDNGDPTIDEATCWVVPMGTYPDQPEHASEYSVSFALKDGSGNVHVDLDLDAGGQS